MLLFYTAALMPSVAHAEPQPFDRTVYDFSLESINGSPMPLAAYKGKVLLVVNTASKCGYTEQYKALQALYEKYQGQGLVVIGVPSNDFKQEPGFPEEIKKFCMLNYGVTFPIAAKQTVTGKDAHPLYQWFSSVLGFGSSPKWNFYKYLVDRQGKPVDYFVSWTSPDSDKITSAVEKLLAESQS